MSGEAPSFGFAKSCGTEGGMCMMRGNRATSARSGGGARRRACRRDGIAAIRRDAMAIRPFPILRSFERNRAGRALRGWTVMLAKR
ncbi:hypothetical protein X986_5353 [Burkholderia pseudomallei]|nr:hypothetical protein BBS_4490 [Burkholderia pseudomallei NAU20B-16]AHG36338.1 hypothetical protein BBQ_4533 [Burkholderia pseudomallei MSHR511]AHG70384.1 hypothetical protein BBN_5061 [Burkholderia pseudomallei MSHR146]AJX75237.1 hypothetical protein BG16_5632 [Burkholderia pseudomallei MSHR2543]KGW37998.1 hypothetical protein Y047_6073 [Burkholderia pseudomallei MSHR3016]KGX17000.1 hypothetical protein X984_6105 [Burkholderia pseudomallei]